MARYVALILGEHTWRVRAVDAPNMETARAAANKNFRMGGARLVMLTSDQAEKMKNSLERCESKRVPDVDWKGLKF